MSLRSISLLAFAMLLPLPAPATAADVMYISPYNRRTITPRQHLPQQPLQRSLSEKEQQLKAYQDVEAELIKERTDTPALTKQEIEAIIDKKMGKPAQPAIAAAPKPAEKPEDSGFGPIGGVGTVGGIGAIGGIGQSSDLNAAEY